VVVAFTAVHPVGGDAALAPCAFAEQQAEALAMEHAAVQATTDFHPWPFAAGQQP